MKAYLYEIKNLLTGESETGITKNQYTIWNDYLEKGKKKINPNKIGLFMLTQKTSENICITIHRSSNQLRHLYSLKSESTPVLSHGNSQMESSIILKHMKEFEFMLDGKERLLKIDLLGFCEYLREVHDIKVGWTMIKNNLIESGNLVIKRSHGITFYIIDKEGGKKDSAGE